MLLEAIMHYFGWVDIWYAHPGPDHFPNSNPRWMVGKWTGFDGDLICTRICNTREEERAAMSPSGWTITHAFILAVWKELKLRRLERQRMTAPTKNLTV